ncbi:glycosyl transferase family 2 [Geomonas limicola]|uniref:Glycosyl transferase family 2 n=1 Tax=Geomonas limicola TaxID=2740186 RepID=A0A6V8NBY4_9BACT|nr:glycosyltransferase family 2 protein [Geomonas limicola]GFO70128.1 glycosyl transferase family 2 [Geomonas limicola]
MNFPKVSIIIPRKPGGDVRALAGLTRVSYPPERFEVLVAYGCLPSAQRNQAAQRAGGEILFFLDDDSQVDPGFLERAVAHYEDPRVAGVGGPSLTPATDTPLQRAIGTAFGSVVGAGGVRNRYRKAGQARLSSDSELILCNLSFRREVYLAQGGLDERLYPNEENELMDRLQHAGHHLVHDPELAVQRSQRATFRAYLRQMFGYGRGRGEQTVVAGKLKATSLAPVFLLLYLLLIPFGTLEFAFPFLCYLALMGAASLAGSWSGRDWRLFPWLLLVYPALHLVYGAGMLAGLTRPRFRRQVCDASGIEVRCVKGFEEKL